MLWIKFYTNLKGSVQTLYYEFRSFLKVFITMLWKYLYFPFTIKKPIDVKLKLFKNKLFIDFTITDKNHDYGNVLSNIQYLL